MNMKDRLIDLALNMGLAVVVALVLAAHAYKSPLFAECDPEHETCPTK